MRITDADGLAVPAGEFSDAGLPAGLADPRARDILASPMAGRLPGHHDLADLPERLASALLVSGLPVADGAVDAAPAESLLFGLDDGSGDVLAHSPDLGTLPEGGPERVRIHVAGLDTDFLAATADAATVLVDVAAGFAGVSGGTERVPGSGRLHGVVVDLVGSHPLTTAAPTHVVSPTGVGSSPQVGSSPHVVATTSVEDTPVPVPRVGWVDTSDGLVSLLAVVPHGLVSGRLAEFLGAIERPGTISAGGVIGIHELTEGMAEQVVRVLAPMGMIFDADSPWATGST